MSYPEISSRLQAARKKQSLISEFVYDKAFSIELSLDRMEDATDEDKKKEQLDIARNAAKAIRGFIEELK